MIYDNLRGSSAPNDADKGHQVSRHSSPEKPENQTREEQKLANTEKQVRKGSRLIDFENEISQNPSTKNSKPVSKRSLGSRKNEKSGRSIGNQDKTKVEEYIRLKTPTMKQTLELFKERVDKKDVSLLMGEVKNKRDENKSLLKKIEEAEFMLKNLEIRQERAKQKKKLYKSRAIGVIRKIGSVPGKKGKELDLMKTIKKQMKEQESVNQNVIKNQVYKELKQKQRKAIENIIKEGIENERLKNRLNEALRRFTDKLDDGQINSKMMDEELENILDLRRIAQLMGVELFGEDLDEDEIRELYKQKNYKIFKPNENTVNQSAFFNKESLDAIDELGGYEIQTNRSVNLGKRNSSMNSGGSRIKKKSGKRRFRDTSQKILGKDMRNSKFWKPMKKSKSKKKTKKSMKKIKLKQSLKRKKTKNGSSTIKKKSRKSKKRSKTKKSNKKSRSALKRSKSPMSRSQYKLINDKKKRIKKSLISSKYGDKNTSKRMEKKKKKKRIDQSEFGALARSNRSQKTYTDKWEEKKSKRDFSGNNEDSVAIGFESFKGRNSPKNLKRNKSKSFKKSRLGSKSRSKHKLKNKKHGVKLYMNKFQDKLKKKKRGFEENESFTAGSKLWGTVKSRGKSKTKKRRTKTPNKRKTTSKLKLKKKKKKTLVSQIVNDSQVNEILIDKTFGAGSNRNLKNSKMSLLSGNLNKSGVDSNKLSKIKKSKIKKKQKGYKSHVTKSKKNTIKNQFVSTKKSIKSRKSKTPKKGSKIKTRKKKIEKNSRARSSDRFTNSDFRRSNLGNNDSIISENNMLNIRNGKILKKNGSKTFRENSKNIDNSYENNQIYNAGSKSRKTQRSADVSNNRKKTNELVNYNPNENLISMENRGKSMEYLQKGQSESPSMKQKNANNMIVQMSFDGKMIVREKNESKMSNEVMKEKLKELDEFVRSNSKKDNLGNKINDWDLALGNAEKQFEKNLKDSSERMIDTKMIDEELKKLEEMEKSFENEKNREIHKFKQDRISIIKEEREKDYEDQNVGKLISFGPRNDTHTMITQTTGTRNYPFIGGLPLTEEDIIRKLQPFDKRNINCSPEMLFSHQTKNNIQDEVINMGRQGFSIQTDESSEVMDGLMIKINEKNKKKPKILDTEIFEKSDPKDYLIGVPTAEFNTDSEKRIKNGNSREYNNFVFNDNMRSSNVYGNNYRNDDISRNNLIGMRGTNPYEHNDFDPGFMDPDYYDQNGGNDLNERKREVIIQKLNESGVQDPSMGKPELQKTMRTLESEFNSIPRNLTNLD